MNVLLVGAGAVGQVYGWFLERGGARVSFLVKPKYADAARRGFVLYQLEKRGVRDPIHWDAYEVLTSNQEVAERSFDYVILCVSSTALRSGDWLDELAGAAGDAWIVTLQPGLDDRAYVAERAGEDRVIQGLIAIASYAAPLPGEEVPEPGTAFWAPSFTKCVFGGPTEPTAKLVEVFRGGGLPSKAGDVVAKSTFGTALLQTHVCALECAGWSIRALRKDKELLRTANRAMREAMKIGAAHTGKRPPLGPRLAMPWQLGLVLSIAARRAPMDFETFFEVHYTKVRDQSRALLDRWIDLAAEHDLPSTGLEDLRRQLSGRTGGPC